MTSFVTNVCPETPKATSTNEEKSFPYLDVCGLSEDKKQDLEARLLKDAECMMYSFATLVFNSCQSIKQKINPEGLAVCVLALDAFSDAAQVHSPLLKEKEKEIRNASTVEEIFLVLKGHWSFINYGILEHIIKTCGTKEDKTNLQKYVHQLKEFCKRRIFEVPPHVYGSESKKQNWTKLTFKLDKKVPTLEDIRETQRLIAQILDIEPSTLYLCCVDEGCVQLLYLIPSFVAKEVFPLSNDQKIALHDAHILKLDHDRVCIKGVFGVIYRYIHSLQMYGANKDIISCTASVCNVYLLRVVTSIHAIVACMHNNPRAHRQISPREITWSQEEESIYRCSVVMVCRLEGN